MGGVLDNQRRLELAVEKRRQEMTEYHSYDADEMFILNETPVFSVMDFWRYEFSALVSMQASIAEFLVSRALGITKAENVLKWTGYDVSYKGKRIEVKATSYIHSWNEEHQSNVRTFSIAPSNNQYWAVRDEREKKKQSRQSEVYVFCLNTQRSFEHFNPLLVDSWEFYVIPTYKINERCERIQIPNQKKIRLSVVQKMAGSPVGWADLKDKIEEAIDDVDQWIVEKDESGNDKS